MIAQSCLSCGARLSEVDWYFCLICNPAKPAVAGSQQSTQLPPRCDFTWIRTFTGNKFWPLNPREEDVCIEDIAHALALRNRFSGHTRFPYSVAEHSAGMVHRLATWGYTKDVLRWALLHDATEAYLPDIPTPIKSLIHGFVDIEKRLMNVIARKFGLKGEMPGVVKEIDQQICKVEMRDLFGSEPVLCPRMVNVPALPGYNFAYVLDWEKAKAYFSDTYVDLFKGDGQ